METTIDRKPRVVVIGGGFAGQALIRALRNKPVDILLIDKNNYMTFQPLLYQVATSELEPEEIAYPLRGIVQNQSNVRFRLGEVLCVDWTKKRVILSDACQVPFDFLVIAAGTTPNYFGIEGAEEFCFPLKKLNDAIKLRSHVLKLFEMADQNPSLIKKGILNFVITGGGPTGVEMAGALIELLQHTLKRDYPHLPLDKARVVLVEANDTLLRMFKDESQMHAIEKLKESGVHIALDEKVVRVTKRGVYLKSQRIIPTATAIWAVGVKASPLADKLQLEQTRGGRIVVEPDLSVPEHSYAFIAGDIGAAKDKNGNLLPQLGSVANQEGKHIAKQIIRSLTGKQTQPFVFKNPGTMATIGRHAAVAEFPGDIRLAGFFAWLTWLGLHLVLLVGFSNRMHVLISWITGYVTQTRSARLILEENLHINAPSPKVTLPSHSELSNKTLLPKTTPVLEPQIASIAAFTNPLNRINQILTHADQLQRPFHRPQSG